MTVFSEEADSAFKAYYEAFGEGFPMEMHGGTFDEMAAAARGCIENGEPFDPPQLDDGGCQLVY